MRGHVYLYRSALHDDANTLPMSARDRRLLRHTSKRLPILFANHWKNARHLMADSAKADAIGGTSGDPSAAFDPNWHLCNIPKALSGLARWREGISTRSVRPASTMAKSSKPIRSSATSSVIAVKRFGRDDRRRRRRLLRRRGLNVFLRNAWYVAAWTKHRPRATAETILGQKIVFYCRVDDSLVALETCRTENLSKERWGDAIECGYHGLTFDGTGSCVAATTAGPDQALWCLVSSCRPIQASGYGWAPHSPTQIRSTRLKITTIRPGVIRRAAFWMSTVTYGWRTICSTSHVAWV